MDLGVQLNVLKAEGRRVANNLAQQGRANTVLPVGF